MQADATTIEQPKTADTGLTANQELVLQLFDKSVLKQRKFAELNTMLSADKRQHCLDIGADNGAISYLFRQQGGDWVSADLDPHAVEAITAMVGDEVYQLDGRTTPFADGQFSSVVIIDFLEHIHTDAEFMREMHRILQPGGEVIINVPHEKQSLLRRFRLLIGQTDENHGHVRHGYTPESLRELLSEHFTLGAHHTYSKFFSEFTDTMIVWAVSILKRLKREKTDSQKGLVVTGEDLSANNSMFKIYALIYPIVRLFAQLDKLLFFRSGYMLIARAHRND